MKSSKTHPFNPSSKLLHKKWIDENYIKHKEKLITAKPTLSHYTGSVYPHMSINMKRMQKEEERQAEVDSSNKILMQRLTRILNEGSKIDKSNDLYANLKTKGLRYGYNRYVQQKILNDNYHIVRRLNGIKSHYGTEKMEKNFSHNRYVLHLLNDTTKSYEDQSPFTDRHNIHSKSRNTKQAVFTSADVVPPCNSISHAAGDVSPSPFSEDTFISQSETLSSRRDDKAFRKLYRSQEESLDDKELQRETDAKLLKKLLDGFAQPNELLARCLAKRKQNTRQKIADKFQELFCQDLASELKTFLPKDYTPFIEVMLEEDIEKHRANELHNAIKDIDSETVLKILLTSTPKGISQIEKSYKKEFSVTVQEDIANFYPGNISTYVFNSLIQGLRQPSLADMNTAKTDCEEIHEKNGEHLLGAQGLLVSILADDGPNQLKLTSQCYSENYGSLIDVLKHHLKPCKDKTGEFVIIHLVESLTQDKFLNKHLNYLKQGISPMNKDFVRRLALHHEDEDILPILQSFKSVYHRDMMEEIGDRCRESSAPVLQAMVDYRFVKNQGSHQPSNKSSSVNQDHAVSRSRASKSNQTSGTATPSNTFQSPFKLPTMRTYAETVHQRKLATKIPKNPMVDVVENPESPNKQSNIKTDQKTHPKTISILPTIVAKNKESLQKDCEIIHDSLLGFGHGDLNIIDRLTDCNGLQRQNISDKYFDLYQEDLLEELKKKSGEEFHPLYTALLHPTQESLLTVIDKGISESNDNAFNYLTMGLLLELNQKRVEECSKKYHVHFDKHLKDELISAGDIGKCLWLLLENLTNKNQPSDIVDALADKIAKLKKSIHLSDDIMSDIFTLPRNQIKPMLNDLTKTQRKKSLEDFIQSKFTETAATTIKKLLEAFEDPILFLADQIHSVLSRPDILSPAVVYLSELNLLSIKTVYEQKFSITLEANIERHLSSPLRTYLIRLVRGNSD